MKKDYYSNLDIKKVTDNRTLWKTIKRLLSDKIASTERITLIDNDEVVATEHSVSTYYLVLMVQKINHIFQQLSNK